MKIRTTIKPTLPGQSLILSIALLLTIFLLPAPLLSQAEPSALLELQSTEKGFLLPRMTQGQRDAIVSPATGLMIFNTTAGNLEINMGDSSAPVWVGFMMLGKVGGLDCNGANVEGNLVAGQPANGVAVAIPYVGGNGGGYNSQVVPSTGVNGLIATLAEGQFAGGSDSLNYVISGIPFNAGTANFTLSAGGHNCNLALPVDFPPGAIAALQCGNAVPSGAINAGQVVSGISVSIPYAGGNGGTHSGQTVNSTGVTGLTATLSVGYFANGTGSLTYNILGTPNTGGTASFALNIGGQACTLNLSVACGAYVAPNVWKVFMCHNLAAANTAANPFQPGWEINGGYWQWGHKGPAPFAWLTTNAPNFAHGPTGPGQGEANASVISGWYQYYAPNGAWEDNSKTVNDPCPEGFRLPTLALWDGVIANNTQSNIGVWTASSTNYSSGIFLGSGLFLPAGGQIASNEGLSNRGIVGHYWSSSATSNYNFFAENLILGNNYVLTGGNYRNSGCSIRCISE